MTFERQKCRKCKRICFCVDIRSLDIRKQNDPYPTWVCEYDLGWVLAPANSKDKIRQIMIDCGIEDIEKCP